jgi:hypothetical protein
MENFKRYGQEKKITLNYLLLQTNWLILENSHFRYFYAVGSVSP